MAGAADSVSTTAADGRAYEALRGAGEIQFAPLPPMPPRAPSRWGEWLAWLLQKLVALFEWLFRPVGRALGLSWPVMSRVVLVLLALGVLFLAWRWLAPMIRGWRAGQRAGPWQPDASDVAELLADADALAAAGDYDGAVHALLVRSVGQIVAARPGLVDPASTARELAVASALPAPAREAFAVIAARVEASRFALVRLAAADWDAARGAYARFALAPA